MKRLVDRVAGAMGLVVGLYVAFAVIVLVTLIAGGLAGADGGSYPDWLGAVSTLAAVLAAVYAGVQGARSLRIERDRDEQRAEESRMAQARQVAVWAPLGIHWRGPPVTNSWAGNGPVETATDDAPMAPESILVSIRNLSRLPVIDMTVDLYVGEDRRLACRCPVAGAVLDELIGVEIMTPELSAQAGRVVATLGPMDEPPLLYIGWSLTDVTGARWTRVPGNTLTAAPPEGLGLSEPARARLG